MSFLSTMAGLESCAFFVVISILFYTFIASFYHTFGYAHEFVFDLRFRLSDLDDGYKYEIIDAVSTLYEYGYVVKYSKVRSLDDLPEDQFVSDLSVSLLTVIYRTRLLLIRGRPVSLVSFCGRYLFEFVEIREINPSR